MRRPPWTALVAGTVGLLFVGLMAYGLAARAPNLRIDTTLAQGRPADAPPFDLAVLQRGDPGALAGRLRGPLADGRLSLAELRGSAVVVNFWASWCEPCRREAPLLEDSWRSARTDGVVFVGLNMQDARSDARGFLREFEVSYPNVREPDDATARAWGLTGLPETYFLASDGQIVSHVIGLIREPQMQAGLRAATAGRPVAPGRAGDRRSVR
ncbi:MAG: TlpA family protein disulfide reductase [Solirubrobacteraceae bacterium]